MPARTITLVGLGIFLVAATCNPSFTSSVEMTRTIDVLAVSGIDESSDPFGLTGFSIGNEVGATILTEATWVAQRRRLPAAGDEFGACNDGVAYGLSREGGSSENDLFFAVRVIGDTGYNDISGDRDCHCETHIPVLRFKPLQLEGAVPAGLPVFTLGRDELCPNRLDDLVLGESDFDGEVDVTFSSTLRVADGRLFLDVHYLVTNTAP